MTLASWLRQQNGLFVGEINRYDAKFNQYRDYDQLFRTSLQRKTAKEAILGLSAPFFESDLDSYSGFFSSILDKGASFIIEDSKHADWYPYIAEDAEKTFGNDWLNIILFRNPIGWLRSRLKSGDISESQALIEQYCAQYAYYIDNIKTHSGQSLYVDFDSFLIDPELVRCRLFEYLRIPLNNISNDPADELFPIPNAIGGNLRSYANCTDFPAILLDSQLNTYDSVRCIVDCFFPYESPQHNHGYTINFIKDPGYARDRPKSNRTNNNTLDFSIISNQIVRHTATETYHFLVAESTNRSFSY